MWGFLNSWAGQLAGAAGLVLTLAGIFGIGFKVGVRERDRKSDDEKDELDTLLMSARKDAEGWRSEALVWKSRHDEQSAHPADRSAQLKLEEVRSVIADGKSIWFRPVVGRVPPVLVRDGGKPIITVGNLKGGVGKTTLSTHLAAAFAERKKVLFIDLDYQGTGSSLLLRAAGMRESGSQLSRADRLLREFSDYTTLQTLPVELGQFARNLSVVSAHHSLADAEEGLMLKWVIGDETGDIRFNLSKALQSPAFKFDMVIIDAPPRLTTAMTQALAASTHVLIPTQLERKSTEAALYFAGVIREFAERAINPSINVLGVVPNMVQQQDSFKPEERAEISYLNEELGRILPGDQHVWEGAPIYDRVAFGRPNLVFQGKDPGAKDAAQSIRRLAGEIARRVGFEI